MNATEERSTTRKQSSRQAATLRPTTLTSRTGIVALVASSSDSLKRCLAFVNHQSIHRSHHFIGAVLPLILKDQGARSSVVLYNGKIRFGREIRSSQDVEQLLGQVSPFEVVRKVGLKLGEPSSLLLAHEVR